MLDVDFLKVREARAEKVFFAVEDDNFTRALLVKYLSSHGRVVEFSDIPDVANRYAQEVPDIVFLDLHLQSGSGITLMEEIKKVDATANIVILSADSIKENVISTHARGARWFFTKPFSKDKIEDAIRKCLPGLPQV